MSISGAEATVIAGIVGGGSAVLAAGLATIGTYKVTQRSVEAQARIAREDRRFDREADTYLAANQFLLPLEAWLVWIKMVAEGRPEAEKLVRPEPPTDQQFQDMMARLRTFAADDVGDRLDAIHDGINAAFRAHMSGTPAEVVAAATALRQEIVDFGTAGREALRRPPAGE